MINKSFPLAIAAIASIATAQADSLSCNFADYKGTPGLSAEVSGDTLAVIWDGDKDQELRLRFAILSGTPTIQDISARHKGATWITLANNATPDFRVVSGLRRITGQQLDAWKELGV